MSPILDMDPAFPAIYERCRRESMTSVERLYALYKAVEYVIDAGIPGDFVECGVWRGGSVMLIAATLLAKGVSDRRIHLYDTFDGMVAPTEKDRDLANQSAASLLQAAPRSETGVIWCLSPLDQVKDNLARTGYPAELIRFVAGPVEETLPRAAPGPLALLRLDTDWYESTRHELEQLYPLLNPGGVLIIDDYGHWQGARQAVDEYFADSRRNGPGRNILLNRIDYTGRIGVKPG